ncbi:hypothetical protein T069G_08726 [Trichoderma breve]|uniref:Zn(2)-C6 fungal-type domain-containing protein n=1 Tax=Trichoderma breve TaxID=2034170 RepID=A0A9W9BAP7_9HYPO|nr:hypothetical protein T069G_08726 [Trichoderma breve]KAJ4857829.1 hypothetical protein T069G_08726 [Trichoderma breve]
MSTASTEDAASNEGTGTASPTGLNRTCEGCRQRKIKCINGSRRSGAQKCDRCSKLDVDCVFRPPAIRRRRNKNDTRIKALEQKLQELQDAISETPAQLDAEIPYSDPLNSEFMNASLFSDPQHQSLQSTSLEDSLPPLAFESTLDPYLTAVLSVASSSHEPECCKVLFRNTAKYLAEEVAMHGNKSLDLIQAYLVLSAWYCLVEDFQKLMFSQYANMAASLVLDLKSSNDDRTFVACYFLSSSMAFSFRRPSVLRHEPWLDDCIRILETAPSIHPNDRRLIEWTKLQIIAEESISMTGLYSGSRVNFSDDSICRVLRFGVDRATAWKRQVSTDIIHQPMIIHYHMVLISLHEPAFYDGHDMEDFRPPYKLRPLPLAKNLDNYYSLNVANSLAQCVASAQKVIHTFLDIPIEILQIMPVIVFTRITYAAVILMKFDVSARVPQSVACLLDDIEFNPKVLLLQLLNKLTLAEGSKRLVVPSVFRGALSRMTRWYIDQFESLQAPDQGDIFEPMMHVGIDAQRSPDTGLSHTGSVTSDTSVLPLHHFNNDYL